MDVTTTQQHELLLYYYNECGMLDSDRIQRSIDGDPVIQSDYQEIVERLDNLSIELVEPSEHSIRRILEFAE